MKEIELKAWASEDLKKEIDLLVGKKCENVDKFDLYFRRPGEIVQALRIRVNNGELELTAKDQRYGAVSEDNSEYELRLTKDQRDEAIAFFKCLGYEEYFVKKKIGYSWIYNGLHIELLKVNDIGTFLEVEALLPLDAKDEEVTEAQNKLVDLFKHFNLLDKIERTSYRELILNGIQSKPHISQR